jgi:hypothetical protein
MFRVFRFIYPALKLPTSSSSAELPKSDKEEIRFKSEEFFTQRQVAGFNSRTLHDRHLFYLEPETSVRVVCTKRVAARRGVCR